MSAVGSGESLTSKERLDAMSGDLRAITSESLLLSDGDFLKAARAVGKIATGIEELKIVYGDTSLATVTTIHNEVDHTPSQSDAEEESAKEPDPSLIPKTHTSVSQEPTRDNGNASDELVKTDKLQIILDFLVANPDRGIRPGELITEYQRHFPDATPAAAAQAIRKITQMLSSDPKYGNRLTHNGQRALLSRYTFKGSTEDSTKISQSAPISVHEKNNRTSEFKNVDQEQAESSDVNNIQPEDAKEQLWEPGLENLDEDVDLDSLPEGFVPLSRNGIGYVIDQGDRVYYYRGQEIKLSNVHCYAVLELFSYSRTDRYDINDPRTFQELKQLNSSIRSVSDIRNAVDKLVSSPLGDHEKGFYISAIPDDGRMRRYMGIRTIIPKPGIQSEENPDFLDQPVDQGLSAPSPLNSPN